MTTELELLQLKLQVALLKSQSLERDIIVINYKQLLTEAGELQQQIAVLEAEEGKEGG